MTNSPCRPLPPLPLLDACLRVVLGCCLLLLGACGWGEATDPGVGAEGFSPLRHEAPRGTIVLVVEGLTREHLAAAGPLADVVAQGTVFSSAYASTSTAGAARASLLTGQWPRGHKLDDTPDSLEGIALAEAASGASSVSRHPATSSPELWVAPQGSFLTWVETTDVDAAGDLLRGLLAHLEEIGERESTYVWAVGVPAPNALATTPDPLPPVGLAVWRTGHVPPGEVRPQVVGTLDVHATIVHLADAGANAEGHAADARATEGPGVSFGRLLLKQPQAWRGFVIGETPDGRGRAVVRGEYRFWRAENGDEGLFPVAGGLNLVGRPEAALIEDELRAILAR